ncbi:MAG: flagellar FliJ family protein [Nitrospirota bacterium]|nr:flagellar FliJ family protein [Nitrospirota bacterium]
MNLGNVVRFRKQVEDLIKEELALAEWEKSQERAKEQGLRQDMDQLARELEQKLRHGVSGAYAAERYRWLEETGQTLERQAEAIKRHDEKIAGLQDKLKEAHQGRRVIEVIMAKEQAKKKQRYTRIEQREQDDLVNLRYLRPGSEM